MIKIGFIGCGSMGSMLLNGFISSGKVNQDEVIISTKTKSKLDIIKAIWGKINVVQDNVDIVKNARYIFICVKPLEVIHILREIKNFITPEKHIVSVASCVTINNIEKIIKGKVTKIIPSLTSEVKEGITLICHNGLVSEEDSIFIETLLSGISKVKIIEEKNFEVAADFTSCAPGMIAAIFQEFVNAGLRHSNISKEDAEDMVIQTLLGTAKLFYEKNIKFEETITRVATKGGITEEGIKVLKSGLPKVFDEVFIQTINKHEKIKEMIKKDLW